MEGQVKAKVSSRFDYNRSRPASPAKGYIASLSPPPIVRPRAKINSSAKITGTAASAPRKLSSATTSTPRTNAASTPRAPSPFKTSQPRSSPSVVSSVKSKVSNTARPNSALSYAPTPSSDSRQRAFTTTPAHPAPSTRELRHRRGSVSSTLTAPPASHHTPTGRAGFPSSPSTSKFSSLSSPGEENGSPSSSSVVGANGKGLVRVKSKISRLAEASHHSASLPSSPLLPTTFRTQMSAIHVKSTPPLSPLISSNLNHSGYASATSPTASTASSNISHGRYATTRDPPTQRLHQYQPFPSNDDLSVTYTTYNISGKIDPTIVPLPPQSPPTSTLSFSSRSSASRSSVSYDTHNSEASRSTAPTSGLRVNGSANINGNGTVSVGRDDRFSPPPPLPRRSLEGLGIRMIASMAAREPSSPGDGSYDEDENGGEDRKMKDEAKSNRKIEDLEISNRSLLAINISLEATKHRQAKEIRDLRRKLRESRLILPPSTYRAVKSSTPPDAPDDEEDEEDEDDEEEEQVVIEGKTDEAYRRVKSLMETLLDQGRRALKSKPEDFSSSKGGAKVLSEEEARTWRGDDADSHSMISREDGEDAHSHLDATERDVLDRPLTPSRIAVPGGNDGLGSEDEVEASLLEPDSPPLAPIPPITVTPSP